MLDSRDPSRGKPLFEGTLRYCVRCCMPETNEGMGFDEVGICKACRSSEQKMVIPWAKRRENLESLFKEHRSKDGYDCLVPISGGKDSAYQLHLIKKEFGLNPLAVTFSHNLFTETGRENLRNILEKLDIDHLEYTPRRGLVNQMMRQSLFKIGDACWHCHVGVGAFPLIVASKFNIPLVIYGESPAEHSGRTTYADCPATYGADHFLKESGKIAPDDFIQGSPIQKKDLQMFKTPGPSELKDLKLKFLYLGDFIFWDAEYFTEFIIKHYGWKEDHVEGTYKRYKSVECKMPGVHDYTKFLKRGFGRGTDFANQDVRAGVLTREEGFELAKRYDLEEPGVLEYFLKCTGFTKEEFYQVMMNHRSNIAKKLPGEELLKVLREKYVRKT